MQVGFEKDSHYFWTVGKDRFIKYWDGDKVSEASSRPWSWPWILSYPTGLCAGLMVT